MTRPAILLDRDGTLIVEKNYLDDPAQVELERGAVDALRAFAAAGYVLVVVTNQSGVGRGFFTLDDVDAVHLRIDELLAAEGLRISGWRVCPHAPQEVCDCRKPAPGMALAAARELGLDLTRSFVIGDKLADVRMARAVGATGILVLTGHGSKDAEEAAQAKFAVCADLAAACDLILRRASN